MKTFLILLLLTQAGWAYEKYSDMQPVSKDGLACYPGFYLVGKECYPIPPQQPIKFPKYKCTKTEYVYPNTFCTEWTPIEDKK